MMSGYLSFWRCHPLSDPITADSFLTSDNLQLSQPHNEQLPVNCTNENRPVQLIAPKPEVHFYLQAALSNNTRRAYQADLAHFINWGGTIPASQDCIANYLTACVGLLSPATLSRRIVAIGRAHTSQGMDSPIKCDLIKTLMRGIRRTTNTAQRQVAPATKDHIIAMVDRLIGIRGTRDRALLLVGFAGAFRRSELVAIQYQDIEFADQGLVITIPRSKTDQEGKGRKVAIPYARGAICPVLSLKAWLIVSRITAGPIFRPINRHDKIDLNALSPQAVAEIIKKRAEALGLDPSRYSGHSLRAGLVTSAALAGIPSWKIRQQTGHKSDAMLQRYIRDTQIFIDNAAGAIF